MTLWPSLRRPGGTRRKPHPSSSTAPPSVGNPRHVVFAFTTAVGHSAADSIVTSYAIQSHPGRPGFVLQGDATRAGVTSLLTPMRGPVHSHSPASSGGD